MSAGLKIDNRRNLGKWLKGRPHEWGVFIAQRAALRVLPLISGVSKSYTDNEGLTLEVFRACLSLQHMPETALDVASLTRNFANSVRISIEKDAAKSAYAAAAINALSASAIALGSSGREAEDAVTSAAGYAVASASAASDSMRLDVDIAEADMWKAIEADCDMLQLVGMKEGGGPLWQTPRAPVIEEHIGRLLDMYQSMGTNWGCLVAWYEAVLSDKIGVFSIDIQVKLAQMREGFWGQPTDTVISEIADMVGWKNEIELETVERKIKPVWVPEPEEVIKEKPQEIELAIEKYDQEIDERDFFISYSNKDVRTAKLVNDVLEKAGYSTFAQFKDIMQGANFVGQMNKGLNSSKRLISLHSPDYEASEHCQAEWSYAYNEDPNGTRRKLIQFIVRPTPLTALARQVVYRSLIGLPDHKKREEILNAVGYNPPKRSADEAVKALAKHASPDAQLSEDQKLDAGPNTKLDNPLVDTELPDLPIIQVSVCKVLQQSAPGNASKVVMAALSEYRQHLEQRGAQPIVGLLVAHGQSILAEFNGPDAVIWEDAGIRQQIEAFSENHDRLITHFPLNADRERLYAETPVDEVAASGEALKTPIDGAMVELRNMSEAGMITQEFENTFDGIEQRLEFIEASPPSFKATDTEMKRAPPRSRFVLQTIGFFASAYGVANATRSISGSVQGAAFMRALSTAIDNLKKFLSL